MKNKALRIERVVRNETQADVAKALGISVSSYTKYENNETDIPLSKAKLIADYFGKSLDELFWESTPGEINARREKD